MKCDFKNLVVCIFPEKRTKGVNCPPMSMASPCTSNERHMTTSLAGDHAALHVQANTTGLLYIRITGLRMHKRRQWCLF